MNEKQEEYVDDILASGNHLFALINDVLDLSKVEAGQVELEVAPFSLRDALESGVVMVRERATKDGVRVALAGPIPRSTRRGRRAADQAGDLQPALERREVHACGGAVDISAAQVNGEVRVSVADTGPGIAAEDHERIFEEFQQTDAGVEQREGTGSVSPCRSGWSSCTAAGSGSTASSARGARSCSRCPRDARSHGRRTRSSSSRTTRLNMKLFRDVLEATGYRTLEATSGALAVELATQHGRISC